MRNSYDDINYYDTKFWIANTRTTKVHVSKTWSSGANNSAHAKY